MMVLKKKEKKKKKVGKAYNGLSAVVLDFIYFVDTTFCLYHVPAKDA
jgi:hypothetical protein